MASNILSIPFRRSPHVSLSEAIKQYISARYGQHPDMFTSDLETIDRLRADAINVQEPHTSGVKKLLAYAAQLIWIGGKFPIDIGAEFVWYPALGYNTKKADSQNNLRFELANVLFNLASLYSQMAYSTNRTTSEGLKEASNYSCRAAGVISYLKDEIIPDMRSTPPEDMDNMTLDCLQQLLLAQAQECYWHKAVIDGLRDASIAKLAAQLSDYYSTASDFAVKSDAISSEWIHHMTAKHHHFAAVAQYRASRDCLEKRRYGEEVARLRDSLACVNEALREARYINKVVLGDLQTLKNRLMEDLKRAEKDNDIIYLQPVPPKAELKLLDRANMASTKAFKDIAHSLSTMTENGQYGSPLFAKLVPYSVHVAATIYSERRDRLINYSMVEALEGLDTQFHQLLESLNLPGTLQALEKPLGLPPGLVNHAEEIRQQGGLDRIRRYMEDVGQIKNSDRATYQEGVELLQQEAQEDDRARARYGTERWTRPSSQEAGAKLYTQVEEIDGYLKSAQSSDELVEKKIQGCEEMLRLLAGPRRDLEAFVPSSQRATVPPKLQQEASKLKNVLVEASRLETRRRRFIDGVKAKAKADDINAELLQETARLEREYPMQKIEAVQFENLFERRLQLYEGDLAQLAHEQAEQDRVIAKLRDANAGFVAAKRGDTSSREREQALQKLENAYFKYKEIISNLDVGGKFYNDLAKIVLRFREDCKNFAFQRRLEAEGMQNDISMGMASLSVSNHHHQHQREPLHTLPPQSQPPIQSPQRRTEQQQQHHMTSNTMSTPQVRNQPPLHVHSPPTAAVPHPQQAQTVTPGMWNPTAGIRFGGAPPFSPSTTTTTAPQPGNNAGYPRPGGAGAGERGTSSRPPPPAVQGGGGGGGQSQWDPTRGIQFG